MNKWDLGANQVEVWLDETTEPSSSHYCVSLCAADGEEIRCIGSDYEERSDAVAAAEKAAAKRGLPVYYRDRHINS